MMVEVKKRCGDQVAGHSRDAAFGEGEMRGDRRSRKGETGAVASRGGGGGGGPPRVTPSERVTLGKN
ncbi:MAG: hypothetical protein CRN43_22780 [Candidatus Nephrothrix sp. EaCA]|nr:MAG: hypothetical protein CRN43_22780 [Candidatus Nephrothrix sp. EaCA]